MLHTFIDCVSWMPGADNAVVMTGYLAATDSIADTKIKIGICNNDFRSGAKTSFNRISVWHVPCNMWCELFACKNLV